MTTIRPARQDDMPQMVALSERKRSEYETFAPTFWRKAADSAQKQSAFFSSLLKRENVIALVAEGDGQIQGFAIATVTDAPPVYDPRTKACMVDDFAVANARMWRTVGAQLLAEVRAKAHQLGADMAVVVCGQRDEPKRAMLDEARFAVASEWWVNPL